MVEDGIEPDSWPQLSDSLLDRISWPVIAIAIIIGGLSILFVLRQLVIEPFAQNESSGIIDPCKLAPQDICSKLDDMRLRVSYPRKLRTDDRGVQVAKRIVVNVLQTRTPGDEAISLAVIPITNTVALLDKRGRDIGSRLTITATRGIFSPASLYIEHPGKLSGPVDPTVSLVVQIMPPTRNLTQPITVTTPFRIGLEDTREKLWRDLVTMVLERLSLGSILIIVGGLAAGWWERHPRMDRLYRRMQRHRANGDWQSIRDQDCDEYVRLKSPFYPDSRIEKLYSEVAADFEYAAAFQVLTGDERTGLSLDKVPLEWTRKALHRIARARKWDPHNEKFKGLQSVLTQIVDAGEVSPAVAMQALPSLEQSLADRNCPEYIRVQVIRLLRSFPQPEAKATVEKALNHDPSPAVQVEAAWALAGCSRPAAAALRGAASAVVDEWLVAFRRPLVRNPFEAVSAERDDRLEEHFFAHPAHEQLYGPFSVALFAASGSGKTGSRRMLEYYYQVQHPEVFVVVYTDFSDLISMSRRISVQDHVQQIVRRATAQAAFSPEEVVPPGEPYLESLQRLIAQIRSLGYREVWVLVDNIDGYAETQADPRMAVNLARHFVGNSDLLEVPRLYFKLFLPDHIQETLAQFGGLASGRMQVIELKWTEDQLLELLKRRLQQASPRAKLADSLRIFTVPLAEPERDLAPWDIDAQLVRHAKGSPRSVIRLANLLLCHRARTWADSGKREAELHIRREDWAMVLEHWYEQRSHEEEGKN